MTRWIGRWLMGVAAMHTVVAVVQHSAAVRAVFTDGFFDSVVGDVASGAIVWSILFGCVAFIGGVAVDALEKASAPIPPFLGWAFILLGVVGASLMPVSGFWFLLPAAIGVLRQRPASSRTL